MVSIFLGAIGNVGDVFFGFRDEEGWGGLGKNKRVGEGSSV